MRCLAIMLSIMFAATATAEEPLTWEGTWNNKLYGTSGTMTCVATRNSKGVWTATFSGVFQKDPFRYEVSFQGKRSGKIESLTGTATIRNHKYQWQGTIEGDTLRGKYRANSGYNGEFVLKQKSQTSP